MCIINPAVLVCLLNSSHPGVLYGFLKKIFMSAIMLKVFRCMRCFACSKCFSRNISLTAKLRKNKSFAVRIGQKRRKLAFLTAKLLTIKSFAVILFTGGDEFVNSA